MCSGHMVVRAQGTDLASWLVLEYQVWVRVIVMVRVMGHDLERRGDGNATWYSDPIQGD